MAAAAPGARHALLRQVEPRVLFGPRSERRQQLPIPAGGHRGQAGRHCALGRAGGPVWPGAPACPALASVSPPRAGGCGGEAEGAEGAVEISVAICISGQEEFGLDVRCGESGVRRQQGKAHAVVDGNRPGHAQGVGGAGLQGRLQQQGGGGGAGEGQGDGRGGGVVGEGQGGG
eukprot:scaffold12826_cov73-Isochrysis_galbana.AAC.1